MKVIEVRSRRAGGRVGTIVPRIGMQTNLGTITQVTKGGTVYINYGTQVRNLNKLYVTHTEARKHGYPFKEGCAREQVVWCVKGHQSVAV